VRNTNHKPKSEREAIRSPKDKGHWFDGLGVVLIIWPKTGTVAYLYQSPKQAKVSVMIDGTWGFAGKVF
jgi:hypothetical protein